MSIHRLLKSWLGKPPEATAPPPQDPVAAAKAANNQGNDLQDAGDLEGAATCFQRAIDALPTYAEAHVNLGSVRIRQQRPAEARSLLEKAAELKPELWQAPFNLGLIAEEAGQADAAIRHYQQVLGMPSYARTGAWEVQWRLSNLYGALGRYADALPLAEQVVASVPEWLDMHLNIGAALVKLGREQEAVAKFQEVLKLEPRNARAMHSLAVAHEALRNWHEARKYYAQAAELAPESTAKFDLSLVSLLLGDYEHGWPEHEAGLACRHRDNPAVDSQVFRRILASRRYWRGEDLKGENLLVWTEQGIGDTLMMLRYMPLIKNRGAGRLVVCCEPSLARIVEGVPGVDRVILKSPPLTPETFPPDLAWHCSTMSLPFACGTRLATIPDQVPYLTAPTLPAALQARLAALPGLKVGIAWGGNPQLQKDTLRSIPLQEFACLFDIPGISWVSLQKGEPAEQLRQGSWPVHDFMDTCQDFLDTASLMCSLDLIITVDTSIVHLAGALAKPTWLLNRHESEWRWMLDREDSPWYPTLRIFRQPKRGDWQSVIGRLAGEIRHLAATRQARLQVAD